MRNSTPVLDWTDAISRFFSKVKSFGNGCWVWEGTTFKTNNSSGLRYGNFSLNDEELSAHRASFLFFNGYITKGMTIDHLCFNTLCVNPDHLEEVSMLENISRGRTSASVLNSKKTHCKNGHEFTIQNTILKKFKKTFHRACKTCFRKNLRAHYQRIKATALAERAEGT